MKLLWDAEPGAGSLWKPAMLLIACAVLAGADAVGAVVGWSDDFSDVTGGSLVHTNTDGYVTNDTYGTLVNGFQPYSWSTTGTLRLVYLEDAATPGPDGLPGVWSLEVDNVPYSGSWALSYFGDDVSEGIELPSWPDTVTMEDLANTTVQFKYRAVNDHNPNNVGLEHWCRLEPLNNSWANRAGFGLLTATEDWQLFHRSLADATNLTNFLGAVNAGERLKLTLSNEGSYQPGDALQIDDLRIDVVPEPKTLVLAAIAVLCLVLMRRLRAP